MNMTQPASGLNKVVFALLYSSIFLFTACSDNPGKEATKATAGKYDQKIDSLISVMTLAEKVGQLNMYNGFWETTGPAPEGGDQAVKFENIKQGKVGGMLNVMSAKDTREAQRVAVENSRLGIPLIFGYDVIHGYKTMFPVPIAQAASWDAAVGREGSKVAAREAAAAGIHWTFAPMIDISRDARWGRIMESAGEDPYLTSVMTKAWVEGYQGDDLSDIYTIAACAKHFAAYGFVEGGRDYNTVDISNHTLHNVVLPPFKAAVDAGVATFMNSFNEIGGIPATASTYLQRDLLKGDWGFQGFVVSDWGTINELMSHGFAPDTLEASRMALVAGSDMDMQSRAYEKFGEQLFEKGLVDEALLDDAVARILKVKFELGLFDDPYRYSDETREKEQTMTPENLQAARDAGRKSIVLLKNKDDILPLSKSGESIAVIGSLGASKDVPLGSWRAQAIENSGVSILEGIKNAVEDSSQVSFANGYILTEGTRNFVFELTFHDDDKSGFAEAIQLASKVDKVIMVLGEDCYQSGEGRSQTDITLKGTQQELFDEIIKANKEVIVVLQNGRPLAIPEVMDEASAVVETWFLGQEAGNAVADVLFGDYNPSGKLPVSFPYATGQEPLYYNKKNTGRPQTNEWDRNTVFWSHYTDNPNKPMLPFGWGLSYTTFEYSDLKAEKGEGFNVNVSVKLSNTGQRSGKETVQVYIRDMYASETQPVKKLVDFSQVELEAGASTTVEFQLTEEDLGFYRNDGSFSAEPGEFHIMVGGNSEDVLKVEVRI